MSNLKMIRATTGKPLSKHDSDDLKPRPSSAGAKLQSFSYVNLKDHHQPLTFKPKKTVPPAAVASSKLSNEVTFKKPPHRFGKYFYYF